MTLRPAVNAVLAILAGACCITAQADSFTDWHEHDAPMEFAMTPDVPDLLPGSFVDYYTFTVPAGFEVIGSVNLSVGAPALAIAGGVYHLMSAGSDHTLGTADDVLKSPALGWAYDADSGAAFNAVTGAGAGLYAYAVSGTAGETGGRYALTSFLAPVPEPTTLGLMALGLGVTLGAALRRRLRLPAN